jgi:hypothetical protein
MEGRQRRSFTDDYKRQAVDLDRICCQGAWAARFGAVAVGGAARGRLEPTAATRRTSRSGADLQTPVRASQSQSR